MFEWIYRQFGMTPEIQEKLLFSVLLVILLRLLWLGGWKLLQRVTDSISRYELNKITAYLLVFIGVMFMGRIWFCWFEPLLVFAGIIIGAVIVTFKEVLFDLAGWVYLVWRRPFEAGDWLVIGETTGEVTEIDHLRFTMLETGDGEHGKLRSGRIVQIPNGVIFREKLINYSKGYRYVWNEFAVQLPLDSNWQKAKELLLQIVNRYSETINRSNDPQIQQVAERCAIFYNKLTPEVYTQVNEHRIILTVRFLCEPDKRRITMHAIWEDVLREFRQNEDIKFDYSPILGQGDYKDNPDGQIVASVSELNQ